MSIVHAHEHNWTASVSKAKPVSGPYIASVYSCDSEWSKSKVTVLISTKQIDSYTDTDTDIYSQKAHTKCGFSLSHVTKYDMSRQTHAAT